ncbi:DNA polymerase IV, partial [Georgenia sp. 10Sc9-8]|nr:DNA polymerase IV [Georgenia halotolerans]
IVGGEHRGVVTSATYEARAYGVHAAMPMSRARALCPHAVVLPTRHGRYREVSAEVMTVLGQVTPVLEKVSIDEAFLDVSGSVRRMGPPVEIARWVRAQVRGRTGVPASVGVGSSKLVAKLASSHAKPDGLLLVPADASVAFVQSLPAGALWGVGERTGALLERRGVTTVADLAATPLPTLHRWLGVAAGQRLHELSWAVDRRRVEPVRVERSVGTETTFPQDVTDHATLRAVLLEQAHATAARLRAEGMLAGTVSIKVRLADFTTLSRSRTLHAGTDLAADLVAAARALLDRVEVPPSGVRLLGLRAERLERADAGTQATLDEDPHRAEAERAMDGVRRRFGPGLVGPASLVRPRSTTAPRPGDISLE